MHKRKFLILLAVLLSLIIAASSLAAPAGLPNEPMTKQVAAPPSEMAALRLPDPSQTGIRSNAALIPVQLAETAKGVWQWQGELPVDGGTQFALLALAPEAGQWDVTIQTAAGKVLEAQVEPSELGISQDNGYQGELYLLENVAVGFLTVTVTASQPRMAGGSGPDGYLAASSDSAYRSYAHLNHYNLLVGQEVGLVAYLYDDATAVTNSAPTPITNAKIEAAMQIAGPDGLAMTVAMADDGRHNDGAAGDGVFGGSFLAETAGDYTAQVSLSGQTPEGRPFLRTSEHLFPVIAPTLQLSSRAARTAVAGDNLRINLNTVALTDAIGDVQVTAEVWGNGSDGMQPVAWIGGIVTPQQTGQRMTLPLQLNGGWLALAGVSDGLELRNVTVSDVTTHIPMAHLDTLRVRVSDLPESATRTVTAVTDEMLMGARPEPSTKSLNYVGGHKLMLVHGYCSEGVWPGSHFTDDVEFQDFNQNRTHDEFANLIRTFGDQYDSFGIVAHSQGGAASLHLYTYYWSGLDYSSGSRLIQTVGTPYQGTALAGSLALIGEIFGAGCGTNWDLTYDGAALWLSGIPSWARSRVYYHTTSFTDKWWRYDYCNMATDLFLDDPDDGVIEKWAGQLSGANNMGHKTGWCHTQDMRDPGQTTDYSRNSTMNYYANR